MTENIGTPNVGTNRDSVDRAVSEPMPVGLAIPGAVQEIVAARLERPDAAKLLHRQGRLLRILGSGEEETPRNARLLQSANDRLLELISGPEDVPPEKQ